MKNLASAKPVPDAKKVGDPWLKQQIFILSFGGWEVRDQIISKSCFPDDCLLAGSSPGTFLVAQSIKNLPALQETTCNAGDPGSIPGSGRSPEEGNGKSLQYFCLGNPIVRETWWATFQVIAESDTI